MGESLVDQLAAIHMVDLATSGLLALGDGTTFVADELDRWEGEMQRVQRGPLPAMERLIEELRRQQPEPNPRVTLVHGDPKPGNFGFAGDEVSAVYDWELAAIGDPLTDIGYLELLWAIPVGITSRPSSLTVDEFVARGTSSGRAPRCGTASGTAPCRSSRSTSSSSSARCCSTPGTPTTSGWSGWPEASRS